MTSIRTPPSLNWLIKQRLRLLDELYRIDHLESTDLQEQTTLLKRMQSDCRQLKKYIANFADIKGSVRTEVVEQLNAVNKALSIHEIPINIDLINPKKKTNARKALTDKEKLVPQGLLTKSIYECLKMRGSATQKEIAAYVISRASIEYNSENVQSINTAVRYRIKNMRAQNKVEIIPDHLASGHGKKYKLVKTFLPKHLELINSLKYLPES